jgi:superfamily I DNA and/or RNA helicase
MRRLLKEMKLDKIRVMTVDQCQGIQAPIVITDSVRSDGKVGFMEGRSKGHFQWKQNGRFNVGTTRPRITRFHIGYVENMLPKYGDSDLKNVSRI